MVEVRRATFEQVQEAQDELIFSKTGLDILAEKSETVSKETRGVYFKRLAFSLLGKGLDYPVKLEYKGGDYDLGSVSVFARKMAYFEDTKDKKQELELRGNKTRVPISELWVALREAMYKPMDEALTLALKASQEILRGGGGSYGTTPENKFERQQ